jgi:hypothetical protein
VPPQIMELPDYPREFTPDQRTTAYWAMIHLQTAIPTVTSNWYKLLEMGENRAEHLAELMARERAEIESEVMAATAPEDVPLWTAYKDD